MPTDDYIKRSDVLKIVCGLCIETCRKRDHQCIKAIMLNNLPAADVEPVRHGRWEYDSDHIPHCSECGTIALQMHKLYLEEKIYDVPFVLSKRCPECGAKMDEEGDDEESAEV